MCSGSRISHLRATLGYKMGVTHICLASVSLSVRSERRERVGGRKCTGWVPQLSQLFTICFYPRGGLFINRYGWRPRETFSPDTVPRNLGKFRKLRTVDQRIVVEGKEFCTGIWGYALGCQDPVSAGGVFVGSQGCLPNVCSVFTFHDVLIADDLGEGSKINPSLHSEKGDDARNVGSTTWTLTGREVALRDVRLWGSIKWISKEKGEEKISTCLAIKLTLFERWGIC